MKKTIIILTILSMLLSATACVSGNSDTSSSIAATEEVETTAAETEGDTEEDTSEQVEETSETEITEFDGETENDTSDIEVTSLYTDFFEPYADLNSTVTPESFQDANSDKFSAYDVLITEGNEEDAWEFVINDDNGDKVTIWYHPKNVNDSPSDWVWTMTLITYSRGDTEISVTDNCHINVTPKYNTFDKNREPAGVEVSSVEQLKTFMFGDGFIPDDAAPEDPLKSVTIKFGDLVDINETQSDGKAVAIVKAKISPSYSNEATISQNYFNVEDLIVDQGFDRYDEIQYWAVADMVDGSESKVISFTVDRDLIDLLKNGKIPTNDLGSYTTDLWVLPSLLQ